MYPLNVIGPLKTYVNFLTVFKQLPLSFKYMFLSNAPNYAAGVL